MEQDADKNIPLIPSDNREENVKNSSPCSMMRVTSNEKEMEKDDPEEAEKNKEDRSEKDSGGKNQEGVKEKEIDEDETEVEDSSTLVADDNEASETNEKISPEAETVRSPQGTHTLPTISKDKDHSVADESLNVLPNTSNSDSKDVEREFPDTENTIGEESSAKILTPEEKIEKPIIRTSEKSPKDVADIEIFNSEDKLTDVEPPEDRSTDTKPLEDELNVPELLEDPIMSIDPIVEEKVPENRNKQIGGTEDSPEKNIADFEVSPASITEDSNYQRVDNAEEKTEEVEGILGNCDENKKGDSADTESNFEYNQEKNVLVVEPENTEFVQISQEDKHDESQIENQSIDNAEDPFGGDNLNSDNLENMMETDNIEREMSDFQKLGDQADNLQDVVKAKDNFQLDKSNDDKIATDPENDIPDNSINIFPKLLEKDSEVPEVDSTESRIEKNKERAEKEFQSDDADKKEETVDSDTQQIHKANENIAPKEGIQTLETGHVTSDVLPGQDDELCIIPDSMKVILASETVQKDKENVTKKETATIDPIIVEELRNAALGCDIGCNSKIAEVVAAKKLITEDRTVEQTASKKVGKNETKVPQPSSSSSDVVINIDDDPKNSEVEEIVTKEKCKQCGEVKSCRIKVKVGSECFNVCSKDCRNIFKTANNKATDIPSDGVNSKREKRCAGCLLIVEAGDERNLSWETMEFCNEECLGKFQTKYGSYCRNCNGSVQAVSLGKYCVRFGYDVRQFCCSTCLEEFKKGLKVCSYCQKDISSGIEGFLAPVGDKGQFKDFCTQDCMEKYSRMSSSELPTSEKKSCSVCQEVKIVHCEVQINGGGSVAICSDPCFAAFKFVNKVDPDQCSTCKKFFQLLSKKNFVVFYEGEAHMFCNKTCLNVFIITNRKIVPCNWCKVKKYNFDMIKKELKSGQIMMMCSLNCLTLYQVSINAVSARRINCDFCKEYSQAQYHLTMSDATIRNFCSYKCVMNFQSQYTKSPITIPSTDDPVPTGNPKRSISQYRGPGAQVVQKAQTDLQSKNLPVISSVTSLATIGNGQNCSPTPQQNSVNSIATNVTVQGQSAPQVIYKQQMIARPPSPVKVHNKMTQCKPLMHTKGVSVRPHPCTKSTQTENTQQIVIPIPVPIYVPYPMHMYSMPFPVPFPFPLPIPVPIFIPTTRNSAKGIFKDIKRIQEKIPADPFEAELLMMAEMVATEKKPSESDSDSDDDDRDNIADVPANSTGDGFSPEGVDSSNTFGDDMLQMALKMATGELDEPAVDLEAALTPNTITATQAPPQQDSSIDGDVQPERLITSTRGRKRMVPYKPRSTPSKRGRRAAGSNDLPLMPPPEPQPPAQPRIMEPIEKPDANMALKYTFGVNAWRQWVIAKNSELEKQSTPARRVKLFKTELLQLTADELNYSLCLFVKEVRKPNGAEYAPDTIYYLCLGIQQYLFENNRIDNIFTDSYYEKFTDCLNDVAKQFSVLYNDAQYIVTRVEEEHLWESKQLGAHSPHVLLSTLMFFNTKHFNLVTVEEHMQLSFSHIMKHWKRNPAAQPAAVAGKVPGSRNVLLRFYPPQSALEANSRKKKVYEQQENEDNPLRCPVKLYEFYLSKCPESVKTRNDVFYLLPERSCVPDSPVWYSTSALAKENLIKMLYRVKMVKEINVALLTS